MHANRTVEPRTSLRITVRTGVLVAVVFGASCASPKVRHLDQPEVASKPLMTLLHSKRQLPSTREVLDQSDLASTYRRNPEQAVSELYQQGGFGGVGQLALAELCSDIAGNLAASDPRHAIGYYLAAAETARGRALKEPYGQCAAVYDHAAGRVAKLLFDSGYQWGESIVIDGPWKTYTLRCPVVGDVGVDLARYDTLAGADYIQLKHYDFERIRQPGMGSAMVVHRKGTSERRAKNAFLSPLGMTLPVNARLDFNGAGGEVELTVVDLLEEGEIEVSGRSLPLAADHSAPVAVQVTYNKAGRLVGFKAMMHPADYSKDSGLYLFEPFRPNKIPVVFVHGLMSSPKVWIDAINGLRADPVIRENYQMLVYRYPSGYPVAYSAMGLRESLAAFQQAYDPGRRYPKMQRMVLVGHSLGGVLSNIQIRGSGESLIDFLFVRPISELGGVTDEQKAFLRRLVVYDASPDVSRAVLVAAPLRGANMARSWLGSLGRKLIRYPYRLIGVGRLPGIKGMTPTAKRMVAERPDSIAGLNPDSPVATKVMQNPIRSGVVVHTIIGRHRTNTPLEDSDDRVVPYWSSHLDEAESELVVHTSHTSICQDPETIEEIRRILYLHAGGE